MFPSLVKQENLKLQKHSDVVQSKIQDSTNLHIPDVTHKITISFAFTENTVVFPACAENTDSAITPGMEIAESCSIRKQIKKK